MTKVLGNHIWYELMTPDPAAAAVFYAAVIGWTSRDANQPGMDYRLLASPDGDVAGIMALPAAAPVPASWFGYIGVDDMSTSLSVLAAAGGKVHLPATDIPGIGRMAMVADAQDVVFNVLQPAGAADAGRSYAPALNGHCSWNELSTTDQPAALVFYQTLFGWTPGDVMDMGPMGEYRFIRHGDAGIGAVMTAPPGTRSGWTYYFRVADIDAAAARTVAAGGRVDHGPSPVPGDDNIIVGSDPQGAIFALVGKRGLA